MPGTFTDGTFEIFGYNEHDHTLESHLRRDGVTVTYDYDTANRVTLAAPSGGVPATMVELDGGDSFAYDELSRITATNRGPDPDAATPVRVRTVDYDLGGRPRVEVVGARAELEWSWDAWDRPETVTLPGGVGRDPSGAFTGFERQWDSLDRQVGIGGLGRADLGADWVWGGAGRLYGINGRGPLETAVRYGYIGGSGPQLPGASPQGVEWKLGTMTFGAGDAGATVAPAATWGAFGYGWRGTVGDPRDGAKVGRAVLEEGTGLLEGTGWSWGLDTSLRLREAHAGEGSLHENVTTGSDLSFDYRYGGGDELERMGRSDADPVVFESGASGRIASRDGVAFGYDGAGRRTQDDRFSYRWDWRGRLSEITVAPEAGTPYDGHQVRYEYDAVGRVLWRVHLGEEDGEGERPFIEYREYLWEGQTLLAEAGYGSNDGTWDDPASDLFLRWRKTYVPGASGLDDAVQVRVEIEVPVGSPYPDTTYSYLRDELGSVLALVEERGGADPNDPPIIARYRYTPYGEAAMVAEATVYDPIATASATFGGRFPGGQTSLFQGLWTDPVTGIAYARNRWYDARNASWLSEDAYGTVDSTNLYAFVGWGPQAAVDPMGLESLRELRENLRTAAFDEGKWWLMPVSFVADVGYAVSNAASIGTVDRIDESQEALEAGEIDTRGYAKEVGFSVGRTAVTYAAGGVAGKLGSSVVGGVLGRFGGSVIGKAVTAGAAGSAGSAGGLLASDIVGMAADMQEGFSSGRDYAFAAGVGFALGAGFAAGGEVVSRAGTVPGNGGINPALQARRDVYVAWKGRRGIEGRSATPDEFEFFRRGNAGKNGLQLYARKSGFGGRALERARRLGVERAWADEVALVRRTGFGTREWGEPELAELLIKGRVKGYFGHHINSATKYPHLASNPGNVEFLTWGEHFIRHGRNWMNRTAGPLLIR